jgi:histidinol phosphatase-like PHP family hydrolase
MPFFDYHIHTKNSSCCKQDYTYLDVWQNIQKLGLDGFGVSDHYNYHKYDRSFIHSQRTVQQQNQLEKKGFIGLEISIMNYKGDLGLPKAFYSALDYMIISEHIHVAKPFSGFFSTKKRMLLWAKSYPQTKTKVDYELDRILHHVIEGIHKHPRAILGHICNFPVNHGFVPPKTLEMIDPILEALQSVGGILELHHNFYGIMTNDTEEPMKYKDCLTRKAFYNELTKRMHRYSIKFSLGSDAHRLDSLLSKAQWQTFLTKINISESQLAVPAAFHES